MKERFPLEFILMPVFAVPPLANQKTDAFPVLLVKLYTQNAILVSVFGDN